MGNGVTLSEKILAVSTTFSESWQDRLQANPVAALKVNIYSDKAGNAYIDESDDPTYAVTAVLATVAVSAGVAAEIPWTLLTKRYYRARYANGVTAQTVFRLIKETITQEEANALFALGMPADAVVAAGAAGSLSAKVRRLTADLATLIAKDFATQTTLAAVLAKIIAAPATEAKQDTLIAKDFATQATLADILAKIIAAPATEAKQDTLIAKIIAAPATEAKQDTLIAKDFATQTTLAAILAKIIAAPSTEAKQDTIITALGLLSSEAKLEAVRALLDGTLDMQIIGSNTGVQASDTILLDAGVAAHSANDVVSTAAGEVMEFANMGAANELICILSVTVKYGHSAIPTANTGYRLHLYNAAPTAIADNAAFNVIAADLDKYLGYIPIATLDDVGDNCVSENVGVNKTVKLAGTSLYGQLACIGAETPTASKTFTIILDAAAV